MLEKIKKFWNKIEPTLFLLTTLILFLSVSCLIFIYFKGARIFENNSLNLITLILFYSGVYLFLIILCYKIFKFALIKPSLTEREFNKSWKEGWKIAQELKKDIKKTKSENFKKRYNQMKEIDKKMDNTGIQFKSWFLFFIFSIYFGLWIGNFFWAIKKSTKDFWEVMKNPFLENFKKEFKWYKVSSGNTEKYIIHSYISK